MMNKFEIIGLVAAFLTTVSFVPQVYKTWKTKSTESLSLPMYLIFFVGVFLWFIYGVYLKSLPMIIANSITGILTLGLIILKIRHK